MKKLTSNKEAHIGKRYVQSKRIRSVRIFYTGEKFLLFLLCTVLVQIICRCVNTTTPMAGGSSSTEVGTCTIKGKVIDSLDNPVSGSIVRLRPFDYIPSKKDSTDKTMLDVYTDKCGRYFFDSVKIGQYCVESVYQDTLGHATDYFIDSAETLVVLPSAKLIPMAIIIGKHIQTIPDIETKASVQTIGMEHTVTIDASGNFIMRVPAGWTRLSFQGIDPSSSLYDSMALIYGKPGEKVEFVQPITGPEDLCTDLDCDLATVRKILDSTGLYSVVPESVVIISDNRVSELHLRGKGVFRLCGSIGKLTSLRLLDIGKNKIDSIPSFAFENLYFLETVSADNNALRFLPGSIGQLKALQSLDLSSNQLQSLPEPIMYLNPSSYLNLANNYLCDIGASTVKWADRYSPGWKNMQKCVIDTQPGPNDPCSDLKCDIAVVKEILDSAYISVAPESVIVIESNSRVSELHLRSRSMKKLIPAVSRLPFLRVLDIGENYIDSLPPGLDRLYNLQELTADHNAIRTFPISVAKLKVTRLDFSYNSLPSLPDQITSLSPSFLNLQYNMLCNISESTAKWADKYDSKWRWSQKCN